MLRHETSPYLLQHADNPVALAPVERCGACRRRAPPDRPILLSVGYAACHWCHVMAHESFEDPDIAALMNALYVNIKVDREERPDIDQLYMAALHALGEQGGWPLTMFLTPDGDPFWGGTYFPPTPRWGRPSFRQVLRGVAEAFRSQRDAVRQNAGALRQALAQLAADAAWRYARPGDARSRRRRAAARHRPRAAAACAARRNFPTRRFSASSGRPPCAPAIPPGRTRRACCCAACRDGGIYDHLGGGFSRYSTDAEWLVPHFEKMLYDNAQLLDLLALAHAAAPEKLFAERAAETVLWLTRDMSAEQCQGRAAFAASEDADSEGEEGRFYVWTEAEIDAALGADGALFKAAYDVTPGGNWEGRTILRRVAPQADAATEARLAGARVRLLQLRAARPRPARDDKVLADWNGLAIAALCRAAAVFAQPDWLARAAAAYGFIRAGMTAPDGRIQHVWRLGRITAAGLLDDQASMARAALALFEATGEKSYLADAIALADCVEQWFGADSSGYFTTAADAADLPFGPGARPRSAGDNVTPSGNGLMAEVFSRLHHLTGAPHWRQRAEKILRAFGGLGDRLSACPTLLAAADLLEEGAVVVVTGPPGTDAARSLCDAVLTAPDPAACLLRAGSADALPPLHPAHGKPAPADGGNAAYVCRAGVCGLPVTDPAALAVQLRARQGSA